MFRASSCFVYFFIPWYESRLCFKGLDIIQSEMDIESRVITKWIPTRVTQWIYHTLNSLCASSNFNHESDQVLQNLLVFMIRITHSCPSTYPCTTWHGFIACRICNTCNRNCSSMGTQTYTCLCVLMYLNNIYRGPRSDYVPTKLLCSAKTIQACNSSWHNSASLCHVC